MYESFFGLAGRPFLAAPRADRYYPAASIEAAREKLARSIGRAEGPGLVIGPVGTGKSLLCHVLAAQFDGELKLAHLDCARLCTRRALLQAVLYELGLAYREREEGELRLSLIDYLSSEPATRGGVLLLVDEAHALPLRLLEEIRMITNLVRDGQPQVRLVLAGSPALEERFASPKLESLNQRVAARCYLEAFDAADTKNYIRAQLAACGGDPDGIFDPEAIDAVFRATGGVPRHVNQVCDHAMVMAFAGGVRQIDGAGIEEAWADLQQLPAPFSSRTSESGDSRESVVEFGELDDVAELALAAENAGDSESASVPFPTTHARHNEAIEADPQLDQLEEQLAELEDDFQPIGTIGPDVELAFDERLEVGKHGRDRDHANPFAESFDEEEVVIDRYASLDDALLRGRQQVINQGPNPLAGAEVPSDPPEDRPSLSVTTLAHSAGDAAEQEFDHEFSTDEADSGDDSPQFDEAETLTGQDDPVMPERGVPMVEPEPDSSFRAWNPSDAAGDRDRDGDMIIVEDDPAPTAPTKSSGVRRQEYRQLFARLRNQ